MGISVLVPARSGRASPEAFEGGAGCGARVLRASQARRTRAVTGTRPGALRPPATGSLTDGGVSGRRRKARPRTPKAPRWSAGGRPRVPDTRPILKRCATRRSIPFVSGEDFPQNSGEPSPRERRSAPHDFKPNACPPVSLRAILPRGTRTTMSARRTRMPEGSARLERFSRKPGAVHRTDRPRLGALRQGRLRARAPAAASPARRTTMTNERRAPNATSPDALQRPDLFAPRN